uniref:Uncharacterized protein n=1 Tax=Opuntia streptacantha TaxID=393608 RepID=A0A7C8YD48_OPUST
MLNAKLPFPFYRHKGDKLSSLLFSCLPQLLRKLVNHLLVPVFLSSFSVHTSDVQKCHLSWLVEALSNWRLCLLIHVHDHLSGIKVNEGVKVKPTHVCLALELDPSIPTSSHHKVLDMAAEPCLSPFLLHDFTNLRLCIIVRPLKLWYQWLHVNDSVFSIILVQR